MNDKKELVLFYKNSCPFCHEFEYTWEKLKESIKSFKFTEINLNDTKNQQLREHFKVKTVPTLYFCLNDKAKIFKANNKEERNYNDIVKFISQK